MRFASGMTIGMVSALFWPQIAGGEENDLAIRIIPGSAAESVSSWTESYSRSPALNNPNDMKDWTADFAGPAIKIEYARREGIYISGEYNVGRGAMDDGGHARSEELCVDIMFKHPGWRTHGWVIGWRTRQITRLDDAAEKIILERSLPVLGYAFAMNPEEPGLYWTAKMVSPTLFFVWLMSNDVRAQVRGQEYNLNSFPLIIETEFEFGYRGAAYPLAISAGGRLTHSEFDFDWADPDRGSGSNKMSSGLLFLRIILELYFISQGYRGYSN